MTATPPVNSWPRFVCPSHGTYSLADGGFLSDPIGPHAAAFQPATFPLLAAADEPCVVLLGEPGIGKSVALRELHEAAVRQDTAVATDRHDLSGYASDQLLVRRVFDGPAINDWRRGTGTLTLTLDGLDECLLRVDTLAALLADELGRLPCDRLRLRLGCRTAVWPGLLADRLRGLFGDGGVSTFELLPLRRTDVLEAAVAAGIDPAAFLREVVRREAVPLAIRPVTLRFLLAAFADRGRLPASQAELYRRGCEYLAREGSPTRAAARRTGALSVGQRLTVAGRIAAVSLICRRPVVVTVPAGEPPAGEEAEVKDLIGGQEAGDGLPFTVTEATILEALDTGLFSGRGPGRLGFSHRTYAEFLAADYLTRRDVPDDQLLRLVTLPTDAGVRVLPQLLEVAGWLATLRPSLVPQFVAADPAVLLGCDLAGMDVGLRAGVVDALLGQAREGRFLDPYLRLGTRYRRLDHPDLAAQLRPAILDRAAVPPARRLAIDIAEACGRADLVGVLADVALDPTDEYHARVHAAYAVGRLGDGPARDRLRPLVAVAPADDPDDSLKGVALTALFPDRLSAAEAFAALTGSQRRSLYGAYAAFLTTHLPDRLRPDHLPPALAWLGRNPLFGPHSRREGLAERIMTLALDHLDDPAVAAGYAAVAVARMREFLPLPGVTADEAGAAVRRQVFEAVLPALRAAGGDATLLLRAATPLVTPADAAALVERIVREADPGVREYLAAVAEGLHGFDADATARMLDAAVRCPALARAFAPRLAPVPLDSDQARQQRASYEQYLAWQRESRERAAARRPPGPPPRDEVARLLGEAEAGDLAAWWRLNLALLFRPDGGAADELEPDLTTLPGWAEAAPDTRGRLIAAARAYLLGHEPRPDVWLGANRIHRPDWAGFRALWLLDREAPAALAGLPADVWRRWGPVAVGYPPRFNGERIGRHRELVRRAYAAAPDAMAAAVERVIDAGLQTGGTLFVFDLLRDGLDARLAAVLLARVRADRLRADDRRVALGLLLDAGDPATAEYLASLVPDPPPPVRHRLRRERAVQAAAMLCGRAAAGWAVVWAAVRRDAGFGREVFAAVAEAWDMHRSAATLGCGLSEEQAADLYLWLAREFPSADDPRPDGVHEISARETVGGFRDAVFARLRDRGTPEAAVAVERIARERPGEAWLRWAAETARQTAVAACWRPPTPAHLRLIVDDGSRRLVETGGHLLAVLRESLARLDAELQGVTPAAPDLWNTDRRTGRGTPKDEAALSDYIARHFRRDLVGRGVVVNREVEIRRGHGDAAGERSDILVTAAVPSGAAETGGAVTVVVEVKGCWNRNREADLTGQLRDRYLQESGCRHGLYVVGWFACDQWEEIDRAARRAPREPVAEARRLFDDLARQASLGGTVIEAFVLNAARR
jgi:hypothetical protein